jgi:hypothetical protein
MLHAVDNITTWCVRILLEKFASGVIPDQDAPYAIYESEGNLALNEGLQFLLDLLIGVDQNPKFNNANAHIGVGDGTTAAAATQLGLQGANKSYRIMDAGYPTRTNQTVTFRATFPEGQANFAWQEWTVANGSSDSAVNLNRKVESLGTKPSTEIWRFTVQITAS